MNDELSLEERVLRSIMEASQSPVVKNPQRENTETPKPSEVSSVLTNQDRVRLAAHKDEILHYLRQGAGKGEVVQAGDLIRWVSPVVGPAGPATVLARSGQWLLVDKPSHEAAVPIVHENWDVRCVGRRIEKKVDPKG